MRVFVSSVRRGLEVERDSLPGLLRALGHEPVRFEDFGAQTVPSREACLRGVAGSDAYLLLLGSHYGHVFPETGQSATHDEWVAATSAGLPRLVFRKTGVTPDVEQEEFIRLVGDYGSGVFYAEYTDVVDLQARVAQAVRELEAAPPSLTYEALAGEVEVRWRADWSRSRRGVDDEAWVEIHATPVPASRIPARVLREMEQGLPSRLRTAGAVPDAAALAPDVTADSVSVELQRGVRRGWDDVYDGDLLGVRLDASGQVSMWRSLPGDRMGSILDPENLRTSTAASLRLIGALRVLSGSRFALGIGLDGSLSRISEGRVTGVARSRATMAMSERPHVRVEPDESVSGAAFDRGADEVARALVDALLLQYRTPRSLT